MPRTRTKKSLDPIPTTFEQLVHWHPPLAIHDRIAARNAQRVIDRLTGLPKPTRGQLDYLDTMTTLFEAFENEHERLDLDGIEPVDVVRHLMEEHDLSASDVGRLLGDRALGSRILNGERQLSKTHIQKLSKHFRLDPGIFLR